MKEILEDAIKSHYEGKDYTEVVRDALLCLTTEIRSKSDLKDVDGVDLINKAFSESKPLIKINNLDTVTDKNKQRGVADLSKGLIEYFRNPMSHSKQQYSKKMADAILVLLDEIILEEIIGSKSINSVEDWYIEITNDLFPNTERYAKSLVENMPKNKQYELLVMLYKNRNIETKPKDKIYKELVNNLSDEEFNLYCQLIEKGLFGDVKEEEFILALKCISSKVWNKLSSLTKSKIEDVALEDISKITIDYEEYCGTLIPVGQNNGYILESVIPIIEKFSNLKEIIHDIVNKIITDSGEVLQEYLFEKYLEIIIRRGNFIDLKLMNTINDRLKYRNHPYWYSTVKDIIKKLPQDNEWYIGCAIAFGLPINEETNEINSEELTF